MPKNRVMYIGVLLLAASALLWLGGKFLAYLIGTLILPIAGGVGIAMIIGGMLWEAKKGKSIGPGDKPSISDSSNS